METPQTLIAIAGDAAVQVFLSPSPTSTNTLGQNPTQACQAHWQYGGAGLYKDLLIGNDDDGSGAGPSWMHVNGPSLPWPGTSTASVLRTIFELGQHDREGTSLKLKRVQAIDGVPQWHTPGEPLPAKTGTNAALLWLLQDAEGDAFSQADTNKAISQIESTDAQLLVYRMTQPLRMDGLWDTLRHGPSRDSNRLVVIVTADELRAEGVELSHGLSWERTCEDFVHKLATVGRLVTLVTCAHLVVLFGADGVIYHRGRSAAPPVLFFDPLGVEGVYARRHLGSMPAATEVFVAGFIRGLVSNPRWSADFESPEPPAVPDMADPAPAAPAAASVAAPTKTEVAPCMKKAISHGLQAVRRLVRNGIPAGGKPYSAKKLFGELSHDEPPLVFTIPSNDIVTEAPSSGGSIARNGWSLLDRMIGDAAEIGRLIVKNGMKSIADQVPMAQLGQLFVFDRQEIESFRTLFNVIEEYLLMMPRTRRPLHIALCGPVGSGKAFAAMQIALSAVAAVTAASSDGPRRIDTKELRLGLSEATDHRDLLALFRAARDATVAGSLPLVYINGFDSRLGRLGKFLSGLQGCVDVLGPNRVGLGDRMFPVRRAVVLRHLIALREPQLLRPLDSGGDSTRDWSNNDGRLEIDDTMLNSLLLTPTFRHGVHSIQSILTMCRLTGYTRFERAALPPPSQLHRHVDQGEFLLHSQGQPFPKDMRERVAKELHNQYRQIKEPLVRREVEEERIHKAWTEKETKERLNKMLKDKKSRDVASEAVKYFSIQSSIDIIERCNWLFSPNWKQLENETEAAKCITQPPTRDHRMLMGRGRFLILYVQYPKNGNGYKNGNVYKQTDLLTAAYEHGWIDRSLKYMVKYSRAGVQNSESAQEIRFAVQVSPDDTSDFYSLFMARLNANNGTRHDADWVCLIFGPEELKNDLGEQLNRYLFPHDHLSAYQTDLFLLPTALLRWQVEQLSSASMDITKEINRNGSALFESDDPEIEQMVATKKGLFRLRGRHIELSVRSQVALELATNLLRTFRMLENASSCGVPYSAELVNRVQTASATLQQMKQSLDTLPARLDAQQTSLDSQSKIALAKSSERKSKSMGVIAVLTLVFLPGTFVATLFGMSMFNWKIDNDNSNNGHPIVSPFFWIYVVVTVLLTLAIIAIWKYWEPAWRRIKGLWRNVDGQTTELKTLV